MIDDVVAEFLDYLRRAAFPRPFLPTYEREARRFLQAFPGRDPMQLTEHDVVAYLGAAKAAGASDQQLRDLKVASEAVVWFLKHRAPARRSIAPPGAEGRTRRKHRRVVFIRDVMVHGLGQSRASDLSHGGMFLETMTNVGLGSELDISFRVFPDDPRIVSARVRVVYEHPQVGAGLMFIVLSAESQALIDAFVASAPESEGA
jgi:hypothetical protein